MELFWGCVGFIIGALIGSGLLTFLICSAVLNKENEAYERGYEDGLKEKYK